MNIISDEDNSGAFTFTLTERSGGLLGGDTRLVRLNSSNVDRVKMSVVRLTWDNIQLGELLGKGAFNQVNEAFLKPKLGDKSALYLNDVHSYALKFISDERRENSENMKVSLIDLQIEANLLSDLSHKHVIKLHAVNEDMGLGEDAFLLIDRLFGTVEEKIQKWTKEQAKRSATSFLADSISMKKQYAAQDERLHSVATPVAAAMDYLHSKGIVFRDLKPANIGFGCDGAIKIFDFGLARKVASDGKRLTGCTGTIRYMAPEVAESQHYGISVDMYAFGILMWELCTLQRPYDKLTPDEIMEWLVKDKRPKLTRKTGSPKVQNLITSCWDGRAENRPSFTAIREILASILTSPGNDGKSARNAKFSRSKSNYD
jgi:serine/threonine protein kinase